MPIEELDSMLEPVTVRLFVAQIAPPDSAELLSMIELVTVSSAKAKDASAFRAQKAATVPDSRVAGNGAARDRQ